MPLIQVEPARVDAAEDGFSRRRSGSAKRGLWVALGGIVAVGVGSYFGVQAYLARADTTTGPHQVQARLLETTTPAQALGDPAPPAAPPAESAAQHTKQTDELEPATDLSELPKVREKQAGAAKQAAPSALREPASGRAPADEEAAVAEAPETPSRSRSTPQTERSLAAAEPGVAATPAEASAASAEEAAPSEQPSAEPTAGSEEPAGEGVDDDVEGAAASAIGADSTGADSTGAATPTGEAEGATAPAFNVDAARAALSSAAGSVSHCKAADGPTGTGRVLITFAVSGRVTSARVEGSPFAGTTVGGCVARAFRSAAVPPFSGDPQTVAKSFTIK